MFKVIKNGLVHTCDTPERYEAFKAAGWSDYTPTKTEKEPKKPKNK